MRRARARGDCFGTRVVALLGRALADPFPPARQPCLLELEAPIKICGAWEARVGRVRRRGVARAARGCSSTCSWEARGPGKKACRPTRGRRAAPARPPPPLAAPRASQGRRSRVPPRPPAEHPPLGGAGGSRRAALFQGEKRPPPPPPTDPPRRPGAAAPPHRSRPSATPQSSPCGGGAHAVREGVGWGGLCGGRRVDLRPSRRGEQSAECRGGTDCTAGGRPGALRTAAAGS